MSSNFAPDARARRVALAAGATRHIVLRAGAAVVCLDGSVRIEEPVTGPEAAGNLPCAVSVRINAGEGHGLAYGGVARVTAIGPAEIVCLDRPGLASRLAQFATAIFLAGVAQNRKKTLGALHKISK
ncbi:hypothetical protein ACXIUT_16055 [Achromobacter denitrificans]